MSKIGRNDPCTCGSGKKYKTCCGRLDQSPPSAPVVASVGSSWQQAVECYSQGRSREARALCERILSADPNHADAWHLSGVLRLDARDGSGAEAAVNRALALSEQAHYRNTLCLILTNANQLSAARTHAQRAIELAPRYAEAHYNLGRVHECEGNVDAAETCYRHAIAHNPAYVLAHSSLGDLLASRGRYRDAIACFRTALTLDPTFAEAHNNLGNALRAAGELDGAMECYRAAVRYRPGMAQALRNLASTLAEQNRWSDAVEQYWLALTADPLYIEAHCELAVALDKLGDSDKARARLQLAIALAPKYARAHRQLGQLHQASGDWPSALACYERLLNCGEPDHFDHALIATALRESGRFDEATHHYRHAIDRCPDFAEAHNNLGLVYKSQGAWPEAEACFAKALAIRPQFAEAHCNMGLAHEAHGDVEQAIESYRAALQIQPNFATAFSNLMFAKAYGHPCADADWGVEGERCERACAPPAELRAARERRFALTPLQGRRLRVGYLSGDFREHPVAYFIERVLAHHDASRLEVFAYMTNRSMDAFTDRIRGHVHRWRAVAGMSDAQLRNLIESDRIDVLIDLSGHTAHNRMGVIARRAAPVQAHYLGFFATTGLKQMDYWLGDDILSPSSVERHFVETVWRLPRVSVAYAGREDAPRSAWKPDEGRIWLGSFNNLLKINAATLGLWSDVLAALPDAHLLLKTQQLADPRNHARISRELTSKGIDSSRLHFHDARTTRDWRSHMACYDRLDIALDPIGSWGGNTTTCDALWMGVPVITLLGATAPERMAAPMLRALGHGEWIAESRDDYVRRTVALARDVERRRALRVTQRDDMRASPLCDAAGLARCLEAAYCEMYERALLDDGRRESRVA